MGETGVAIKEKNVHCLLFPTLPRSRLRIPLPYIQRYEKPTNAVVCCNCCCDFYDFLFTERLFQLCKHVLGNLHVERHGIRIG
jgi:hypothetical protein